MPCLPDEENRMTFAEATRGTEAPLSVMEGLCLVDVSFRDFTGRKRAGQLVVHESVRQDMLDIFALMEKTGFPLSRVIPISAYDWSDDASMAANNTSAFNYRFVAGTGRLSRHALGLAVDINPFLNPVMYADGRISPPGARYLPGVDGTLTPESPIVLAFLQRGWQWGGLFQSFKDYHHFEKSAT